ncbi:hypothetical protein HaLaN_07349 [Haematococcus lacustris]|uniref:Uncharacterized protein n=1 Tax=Haematococcus lacustris TaxID=44745 RepID=A0A699YNU4_HAELA|nr:hypothetical protein HaLaN_07349 [Haematococcus lacustris]
MCYIELLAPTLQLPQTEYTQHYNDLLAYALAKLDSCAAVEGFYVSSDALASLLSHPPLARQLQQLDLANTIVMVGNKPRAVGTLFHMFQGLQLKQLSIAINTAYPAHHRCLAFSPWRNT